MKEYEKPSMIITSFEAEDVITTSGGSPQFTQSGDVTGQTTDWKVGW